MEQNQINLGSKVRSLSFCLLLNIQMVNTIVKKIKIYRAIAMEKSMLIISRGKVNLDSLVAIWHEVSLSDKEIMADVAHRQQIHL